MQVILSCMAIAVLGIALNNGMLFLIQPSISLIVMPVTTDISNFLSVNSFLTPFNTSFTWKGFTAKRITSAFFTAAILSLLISIPFSFNECKVAVFLLVIMISAALLNLLFNNPSAMAVPRLPPPMMAIRLPIILILDKDNLSSTSFQQGNLLHNPLLHLPMNKKNYCNRQKKAY